MDAIVAHCFPSQGNSNVGFIKELRAGEGRDCGLYMIENVRSMDSGMPLHEANDVEVRMTILSEVMQLARQILAQAAPTSEWR